MFVCSAWEDFRGVPPTLRLGVHGVTAALFLWWSGSHNLSLLPVVPVWMAVAGLAVFIVWMANLYNFMDGADGLAAGMAANGFTVIGIEASAANVPHVASILRLDAGVGCRLDLV